MTAHKSLLLGDGAPLAVRAALGLASLCLATLWWLPMPPFLDRPHPGEFAPPSGVGRMAAGLAQQQIAAWSAAEPRGRDLAALRAINPEWDLMSRSITVLAFANLALRDPRWRDRVLPAMDTIIWQTLREDRQHGVHHFLLPYSRQGAFAGNPPRSLFVEGQIGLMLAARRFVHEDPSLRGPQRDRVRAIEGLMSGPLRSGESYPNECWTFCNTTALAVLRMADVLDGTDHSRLVTEWVTAAKARLTDPRTGLLVASFDRHGRVGDGPEGSSIWWSVHNLQLLDPELAREQYQLARRHLGVVLLGYGYAREWPLSRPGRWDVDSGPIVPVLGASAGSSGLAMVAAAAFRDTGYLGPLLTSLNFAGFPQWEGERLRYCASNAVGDAVLLYALSQGPLWERVRHAR